MQSATPRSGANWRDSWIKLTMATSRFLITRGNNKPTIIMALEDYQAYEETAYLMASPRNAERLNRAIADIDAGNTVQHGLMDE